MTKRDFVSRRSFLKRVGLAAASLLAADSIPASAVVRGKPNVLFIICDDLNDYVAGMGGTDRQKNPTSSGL